MLIALNGFSTMHCNLAIDYRIARETGYDALEVWVPKLVRYLDVGYTLEDLKSLCCGVRTVCLNALSGIERIDPKEYKELLLECERLCVVAKILRCPTVQLVPTYGLEGRSWAEVRELTAKNIRKLADIAAAHGIKLQMEVLARSPIHTLAQILEVLDATARENVGMVIDFWHLWAGGGTAPDDRGCWIHTYFTGRKESSLRLLLRARKVSTQKVA